MADSDKPVGRAIGLLGYAAGINTIPDAARMPRHGPWRHVERIPVRLRSGTSPAVAAGLVPATPT